MITKEDVFQAQQQWADALVAIGQLKGNEAQCEQFTREKIDELYDWSTGSILFKPTKAAVTPFRAEKESVLSYFIGDNDQFPEDSGFALQPWVDIEFENTGICLYDNTALAMGHYYFTDTEDNKVKVEYSFSYVKQDDGSLKIQLHHSSLPYQP